MNTQVSTLEAPAVAPITDHEVDTICRAVRAVLPEISHEHLQLIVTGHGGLSTHYPYPVILAGMVTAAATMTHPEWGMGFMSNVDRPHWQATAAAVDAINDYHQQRAAL